MKVASSTYLTKLRPLLKDLIGLLNKQFDNVSILAADCSGRKYSVSKTGTSINEDGLLTDRGFVVQISHQGQYFEYSYNSITPETIKSIADEIIQTNPSTIISTAKQQNLSTSASCISSNSLENGELTSCSSFTEENQMLTSYIKCTDYEESPETWGDQRIADYLAEISLEGRGLDSRIVDFQATYSCQFIHKIFLSPSKDLEQNLLWSCCAAIALAGAGEEIKTCYRPFSLLGGTELLYKLKATVKDAVSGALELIDASPIVPGEYDCICAPEVTGMIAHEAFGHGVEMDMFVKDRALAKNYIGKQVASELITMHDGALTLSEVASFFFDDEGNAANDTIIINKGILEKGICDSRSAHHLNTSPTGNGRRESTERKAYTRMTNTIFEPGKDSLDDMISSIKSGFLLTEAESGMEDPKNWGIQLMVNKAYEIKDGKLTGKLFSPVVLTGYVPDLLKSITMVSDTLTACGSGFCGKGYKEWVKVSDGGPYIKARIRLG